MALSVLGHNGKNGVGGYFVVVKKIGTVAGDQDLCVLPGVPETVYEYPGGGGMQGNLRLFNTHQPGTRFAVAGALEQGHQNANCSQGAIGHSARIKAPRILGASDFLAELQRFSGTDGPPVDPDDTRNNFSKVLLDPLLETR